MTKREVGIKRAVPIQCRPYRGQRVKGGAGGALNVKRERESGPPRPQREAISVLTTLHFSTCLLCSTCDRWLAMELIYGVE